MGDYHILKVIVCMFLKWNPMSEEVKKIPNDMWPIYYRMYNFSLYHSYDRLYKPQGELIASIVNPETYKAYSEIKAKQEKLKEEGGPDTVTISSKNSIKSASKADTYFDPERGLVDFNGKLLITKEEYLKRIDGEGIAISL